MISDLKPQTPAGWRVVYELRRELRGKMAPKELDRHAFTVARGTELWAPHAAAWGDYWMTDFANFVKTAQGYGIPTVAFPGEASTWLVPRWVWDCAMDCDSMTAGLCIVARVVEALGVVGARGLYAMGGADVVVDLWADLRIDDVTAAAAPRPVR